MTIKFDDYLNEELQDSKFQKEWIRQTIVEFAIDGDYVEFYRALEAVIKARTTIKQFAEDIGMPRESLVKILHGKTKAPSIQTISKILNGLGYTLSIDLKTA